MTSRLCLRGETIEYSKLLRNDTAMGTKVTNLAGIGTCVREVIERGLAVAGNAPGQFTASLSGSLLDYAKAFVRCGDGRHTNNPSDYVVRNAPLHETLNGAWLLIDIAPSGALSLVQRLEDVPATSYDAGLTHCVKYKMGGNLGRVYCWRM